MTGTTIYLVRHSHADWQQDDARPLSRSGLEAAQVVARLLSALPITAIYSSSSRRSVETVAPLADRLGLQTELVPDLCERALPIVSSAEFDRVVQDTWRFPGRPINGGESNVKAQARGLGVVRGLLTQHVDQHVVVATHGTLLALILNGLDSAFEYEFWRRLSFPDVYRLEFAGTVLIGVERVWDREQPETQVQS